MLLGLCWRYSVRWFTWCLMRVCMLCLWFAGFDCVVTYLVPAWWVAGFADLDTWLVGTLYSCLLRV